MDIDIYMRVIDQNLSIGNKYAQPKYCGTHYECYQYLEIPFFYS